MINMWRCKHCNGEIVGTGEIHTEIDFELDEHGNITEPNNGFTLKELVQEEVYVYRYCCEDCGFEVDNVSDLGEIAEWREAE